jgi:hypothetical protein
MTPETPYKLLTESHSRLRSSNLCKHLRDLLVLRNTRHQKSSDHGHLQKCLSFASLRSPKKGSYKNDDEIDDSKSYASFRISFWGLSDLSRGIEKLFKLIKLNE